jgi:hypothetical protein
MGCEVVHPGTIEFTVDTKQQTHDQVMSLIETVMRQYAIVECGIMARFSITLGDGAAAIQEVTPSAELKKLGVVSMNSTAAVR